MAVGSELLRPDRMDTNSLWLTEQLEDVGINVLGKCVAPDDDELLQGALQWAWQRFEYIFCCGGLGPTVDDRTREAIASTLKRPLQFHTDVLEDLRARFARWGRVMPENNRVQAMFVEGSEILPNPRGTAPGMWIRAGEQTMVVLPGPPKELQPMFTESVLPRLQGRGKVVRRRLLRVIGMGESAMDEKIAPIYKDVTNPGVTTLFSPEWLEIHLTAEGERAEELLDEFTRKMSGALGPSLFSTQGETLAEVVGKKLQAKNQTLACAESLTGGMLAQKITEVSGSSAYFKGSFVTYATELKHTLLGVDVSEGPVRPHVAEQMASAARRLAGSDYALSLTGFAGPTGGTDEDPVGTVYFGLADPAGVESKRLVFPGDRELVRQRASQAALDWLRRRLME